MPKVAIIYLLYNGRQYLADCFRSLEKMNYPFASAEIIIVDNASTDGGAELVKSEILPKSGTVLPPITFIKNNQNLGFAEGNNAGIRNALAREFDYVYLLNQDTEIHPDFLLEAVNLAERRREAGAVQSLILLYNNKTLVNSFGNAIHYLGFGYARGYRAKLQAAERYINKILGKEPIFKMAYASGAGVLYRAAALRECGLFDPELFLYHEDLDLGWRLALAGYENILAPASRIYHKYEFSRSIKKYYWMERNRFIVLFKLYKWPTMVLLAPAFILAELGLLALSARSGWWREKLNGYRYFLESKNWTRLFRARREAQAKRKRPDCEIVDLFTSSILFQDFKNPMVLYFANPLLTLYWIIVRGFIFW